MFKNESWMPNVPLVHIDTEGVDIPSDYDVACEILGNLQTSMGYLNIMNLPAFSWDIKEVQENKQRVFEAIRPKTKGFNPSDAIVALQEVMPKDGILTADVGAHLHLLGQLWNVKSGKFLMTNVRFC